MLTTDVRGLDIRRRLRRWLLAVAAVAALVAFVAMLATPSARPDTAAQAGAHG
jgi:hypothetical protein